MVGTIPVEAGLKTGEALFKAVAELADKWPDAALKAKYNVKEKYDVAEVAKKEFLDYAHSFQIPKNPDNAQPGQFADVLLYLGNVAKITRADFENSATLFVQEINQPAKDLGVADD